MATYTPNYGLHQWVPEDKFLREEFNQDFQKIDAAIKAAENKAVSGDAQVSAAVQAAQAAANRALAALEPLSYNIYNLMLQNYYDGKSTQFKKALLFDGFQDQNGISSLTGAVWDAAHPSLLLDAAGQQNVPAAAFDRNLSIPAQRSFSASWTATGNGTLTQCSMMILGSGKVEFFHGQELLSTGSFPGTQEKAEQKIIQLSAPVTAGQTYKLTLTNTGTGMMAVNGDGNNNLCFSLTFSPKKATSGSITSVSQPVSGTFQSVKVWVRHDGGTMNCSLKGNSGSWKSLTRSSSRTTVNADGVSCIESEFTLSTALTGPVQAKLDLSISSGSQMRVYDYGVILL